MCETERSPLTLSAPAAELSEHRALTQPVEPLLADQLEQLRLQALFEFTGKRKHARARHKSLSQAAVSVAIVRVCFSLRSSLH